MRWLLLLALAACDVDLERMTDQPRYTSYERCDVCPDGTIMMLPPDGTVTRDSTLEPAEPADTDDALPAFVDRAVVARGRNRFDVFCAACHGRLGDGISQVSENMLLRKPANLLATPYPAGHLFRVVTHGFGLMRSYANELGFRDRWAVVAYVQALQLSQHVPAADLTPAELQQVGR